MPVRPVAKQTLVHASLLTVETTIRYLAFVELSRQPVIQAEQDAGMRIAELLRQRKLQPADDEVFTQLYATHGEAQERAAVAWRGMYRGVLAVSYRRQKDEWLAMPFATACMRLGRYKLLERMIDARPPTALASKFLAVKTADVGSAWVGYLCRMDPNFDVHEPGDSMHRVDGSLYSCALSLRKDMGVSDVAFRRAIDFALDHQPGHPHLDELLAMKDENGAIVAEALMRRQIDTARPQPPSSASPQLSSRRIRL